MMADWFSFGRLTDALCLVEAPTTDSAFWLATSQERQDKMDNPPAVLSPHYNVGEKYDRRVVQRDLLVHLPGTCTTRIAQSLKGVIERIGIFGCGAVLYSGGACSMEGGEKPFSDLAAYYVYWMS